MRFATTPFSVSAGIPFALLAGAGTAQHLTWSTLMGGGMRDAAYAVAVDDAGLVTVAGHTESPTWPYGNTTGTGSDAFVARLDPGRTGPRQLVWCTMLAGNGTDIAFDLAMDSSGGSVTVVGLTTSTDLPVAGANGPYQGALNGRADAFVLQLDGAGSITYFSYLGGTGNDWANAVELDAGGRPVLAGITQSASFPTTMSAYQRTFGGGSDAFVAVLDPTGTGNGQLVASTFLGGSGFEGVAFNTNSALNMSLGDVAIAASGAVVVAGRTTSTTFPITANAYQANHAGGLYADMFVARLDPTLSALQYSTYLGGSDDDGAMKVALSPRGEICIAGFTWSPGAGTMQFPTTTGAAAAGANDAVIAVLDAPTQGTSALKFSTVVGGPGVDWFAALLVEDSGVITAGGTSAGGIAGLTGSPRDVLLARVEPRAGACPAVHHLSYLGGLNGNWEYAIGLAGNGDGLVTVAGATDTAFPTTPGALQALPGGLLDAFVATVDLLPAGVRRIGESTPSCRGPVWVQVSSAPAPGNRCFEVLCNGAPKNAAGALVVGTALFPSPLQFLGVDLYPIPTVTVGATSDTYGAWRSLPLPATLPVPANLFVQCVWINPPGCPLGPLSASHALGI